MRENSLDGFDYAILSALQIDASLTSAQLSEQVNLSASQCARRKAALEDLGTIESYGAILNAEALGFSLRAITRVNLTRHSAGMDEEFSDFLDAQQQVRAAYSVSGDADYVLEIHARDLNDFTAFMHESLLVHPAVAQVRSEIVLKTMKEKRHLPLNAAGR